MSSVVRITDARGVSVQASGFIIVGGSLARTRSRIVEPLQTPGVDGVRYRLVHRQMVPLVLRLWEPLAAGNTFTDRESDYYDLLGRPCRLEIEEGDVLTQYKDAVPTDCQIEQRAFRLTGFGEIEGSTRTLISQWTISRQREADQGEEEE